MPAKAESPFARSRSYLLRRDVQRHVRVSYHSFIALTGSCARPKSSRWLQLSLFQRVFAGCPQSLLEDGLSRRYLCNLCIGAWTLTPRCFLGAHTRFFPRNIGLTLDLRRSAHPDYPCNATSTRHAISGLQSFHNIQAPILARPPGCTHRGIHDAGRPGRLHHAMDVWLPHTNRGIATYLNRAIDMTGLSPARLQPCRPLPRPGRAVFPHPVPRLYSLPRKANSFSLVCYSPQ